MSDKKKKNLFARLLRMLICLCLLLVAGFFAARLWVLPAMVRGEVRARVAEVWTGDIEIAEVELNLRGPSCVRGVELRDDLGRTWLSVPEIRIEVVWEGYAPSIKALRVASAAVRPQCAGGACTIPLKSPAPSDDPQDIVDVIIGLKDIELTVDLISLDPVNIDSAPTGELEGIVLPDRFARIVSQTSVVFKDAAWTGGQLEVSELSGRIGNEPIAVGLTGGIRDNDTVAVGGEIRGAKNVDFLGAEFDLALVRGGAKRFSVKLAGRIRGRISGEVQPDEAVTTTATVDLAVSKIKPEQFRFLIGSDINVRRAIAGGDVKIRLDAAGKRGEPIALSGTADFSGPVGRFEAKLKGQIGDRGLQWGDADFTGSACGGKFDGKLKADRMGDKPMRLTLAASAHQIKMPELTRIFTPDKPMDAGVLAGELKIAMYAWDARTARGTGAFFLDNADPLNVPILSDILKHMDIKLSEADLRGRLGVDGRTLSIASGQLASILWAADFEPGGTINLDTGKIDMYAVFIPIKQVGPILKVFDAVNPIKLLLGKDPVRELLKHMVRQHVTGTIDKPVITSVPISDLSKIPVGTVKFFKSVAEGAGQFTGNVLKALLNGGG